MFVSGGKGGEVKCQDRISCTLVHTNFLLPSLIIFAAWSSLALPFLALAEQAACVLLVLFGGGFILFLYLWLSLVNTQFYSDRSISVN